MKINFKKIVPIVTGALLLGSTIGFAASVAGQAATFPTSFGDSVVVIGSASADSAAANDLSSALGAVTTSSSASVSDGHLMVKGTETLNYGENLSRIDSSLDDTDLPTLLASGTYKDTKGTNDNEEAYDQHISFIGDGGDTLVYQADTDKSDAVGPYFKLVDGTVVYNYSLVFTTGPTYDNSTATKLKEDFQLTKLNILGDTWTITNAEASSLSAGPNKFTLMGGAAASTLKTGESATLVVDGKTYAVSAVVYSDKVTFTVNGESLTVDDGSTDELSDGTQIGVTEISTSSKESVADQATFYLGARKLVLENGKKVELNGEDVKGTNVGVKVDTANARLTSISVSYTAQEDAWLAPGQTWTDPVWGKLKLAFTGLKKAAEDKITVSTSSNEGTMKLKNYAGEELTFKFFDDDSKVYLGDKFTKANVSVLGNNGTTSHEGDLLVQDGDYCVGATLSRCEGIKVLVADADGKAKMYELTDSNLETQQITLTEVDTGKDHELTFVNGSNTLDLGLIGDLSVTVNQTINGSAGDIATRGTMTVIQFNNINDYSGGSPTGNSGFELDHDGAVNFSRSGTDIIVNLFNETAKLASWNLTMDSDNDMIVKAIGPSLSPKVADSETDIGIDAVNYGAEFTWESEFQQSLTVVYPGKDAVSGNVYIMPVSSVVSGAGIVPVVKDAELGALKTTKDLVVVGGPAVNTVAAELLGLSFPTYGNDANSGFAADSAMIKLFEGKLTPGKVALLVAGYDAKDTSAAAKALIAEHKYGTLTTTTASTYSYAA